MKHILPVFVVVLFQLYSQAQDYKSSPWHLVADDIRPENYYGITSANGMIGLVSSPDPFKVKDVVLNGAFDTYGRGRVSNILKVFNFVNLEFTNPKFTEEEKRAYAKTFDKENLNSYRQILDMKSGSLITLADYKEVSVKTTLMALRHLPFNTMHRVEITAKKDIEIAPASVIESPEVLRDVKNYYSTIHVPGHTSIPLMSSVAQSPTGKLTVAASTTILFNNHEEHDIIHVDNDYNKHWIKFNTTIKKGETFTFTIIGAVFSSEHSPDPWNEAERLNIYAYLEGLDRLTKRHNDAWSNIWKSDIRIEGDLQAQKDIRSALYHLYAFARAGTSYSMSPMGLSGLGYNGHAFWDTELWMYPPLLLLQPDIAKSLLDYRYKLLDEAKRNAFSHGYRGAMFPWESADTGQEETPVWALTGPFEHHITGDVGWAYWKYYQVTKDKDWLRRKGYDVLSEVADFWVSRVEKGNDGKYHINNVVGADEYAENVDDNAFTNGVAIKALQYATVAAGELGLTPNPAWNEVAENIPLLKFNDGFTQEYRGYEGITIKQADVNLLAYPLKVITDEETIKKDLAYYEPRIDKNGPAMGYSALSVINSRLGNPDKAHDLFIKGYKPNEVPPFGVLAEFDGGTNPYFATGAGGMLQAVLFGFGGLDIGEHGITQLKTALPKSWKSLTISGVGPEKKTFTVK